MSFDQHTDFAYSTIAPGGAPSPSTSGNSLKVASAADRALFPTPPFRATVWPAGVTPSASNAEIIQVNGYYSTDGFVIARAQENTAAQPIVGGYQIAATITTKPFTDLEAAVTQKTLVTVGQSYGADYICTGTSDNIQIQLAINSLPSLGGEIRILQGIYDIDATIIVNNNVTIKGTGTTDANQASGGGTIFKRNSGFDGPIFSNSNHSSGNFSIRFQDFSINGNKGSGSPTALSRGIYCTSAQRVTVFNVSVNNTNSDGIKFDGNNGGVDWVYNCRLRGCGGTGISFGSGGASDCAAWDNEIGSCSGDGIFLGSVSNCIVSGNFIFISGAIGIDLFNSSRCQILGNRVNNSSNSGIRLSGTTLGSSGCTIVGNWCYDNGTGITTGAGIEITDGTVASNNNTVIGNTCSNSVGTNQDYGIYTHGLTDFNTIVGNTLIGNRVSSLNVSGANDQIGNNNDGVTTNPTHSGFVSKGPVSFTGNNHAGIQIISLTTAQRNSISPGNGMVIYNTDTSSMQVFVNSQWVEFSAGTSTSTSSTSSSTSSTSSTSSSISSTSSSRSISTSSTSSSTSFSSTSSSTSTTIIAFG